jgi:hypothetical protein
MSETLRAAGQETAEDARVAEKNKLTALDKTKIFVNEMRRSKGAHILFKHTEDNKKTKNRTEDAEKVWRGLRSKKTWGFIPRPFDFDALLKTAFTSDGKWPKAYGRYTAVTASLNLHKVGWTTLDASKGP